MMSMARDFLVWQRLFGSTSRTVADASLNGVVDAADLYNLAGALWRRARLVIGHCRL